MAKSLFDTDLYVDLIQSGKTLLILRELYDKDAPGIYFSSVVARSSWQGPVLGVAKCMWRHYSPRLKG